MSSNVKRASFIVRVVSDASGEKTGVIERVKTGTKESFHGVTEIGLVIDRMLAREETAGPERETAT